MGYLDYAGLQYLWGKLKEKFAPKSHSHDDRYYTESEMDGRLDSKVNNNEAGADSLLSKLTTSWAATPTDNTYFIRQDTGGGNEFGRVKFSTLWNYIKGKADGTYQSKGSYAASGHTHDNRYYTEAEVDGKLNEKAASKTLSKVDLNTVKTPGFYNAGGGNGCTNVPVSDAFGLIVTHNASGEYYTQIFFLVDKNTSYRRYCNGGAWTEWMQDKLTDTNTWRGIQNNLTSNSTSDSLSAAQGKVLKGLVDGKAPNEHTHSSIIGHTAGNGFNFGYSNSKDVTIPKETAVSTYYVKILSSTPFDFRFKKMYVKTVGDNTQYSFIAQVSANAYMPPHIELITQQYNSPEIKNIIVASAPNYNHSIYLEIDSSTKVEKTISIQTDFSTDASLSLSKIKPSDIQLTVPIRSNDHISTSIPICADGGIFGNLNGKATSAGTADKANSAPWSGITGKPSTFPPASHEHDLNTMINKLTTGTSIPTDADYYVCQYAGGGTSTTTYHRRPMSALWDYIKSKTDSVYAAKSHTHTKAQITDFPTSLKNPTALTIQTNGTTAATYDGSAAKTVNITKGNIGLGNVDNTADANKSVKYATSAGSANTATKLGGLSPSKDGDKAVWGTVPTVSSSTGVTELGKYIDFHSTKDSSVDYDARITAETTGLTITGTTKGTFSGNLTGNASTATSAISATTASHVGLGGDVKNPMTFNWSGQSGQPSWLWGSNNGTDVKVWNPANFNVNSAKTATSATKATTADKAAKLTTVRNVSGGSDITLSFDYDGSGNSTANIGFYSCKHSVGNTNNYPFHRFAKLENLTSAYTDNTMLVYITQDYNNGGFGICRLSLQTNNSSSASSVEAKWLIRSGLSADFVQVAIYNVYGKTYADAFIKINGTWGGTTISALESGGRADQRRTWTLVNSNEVDGTTATDKKTSSECWKTITDAGIALHKQAYSSSALAIDGGYVASAGSANTSSSCAGNSASATKLTSSAGSATQPVYFKNGKPVAGTYTLCDASSKMVRTLSAQGNTGWANQTTDDKYVPTMSFMAYWNGAYGGTASNLQYCDRGRFGTIVTKNSGDYASVGHTHNYAGSGSVGGSANSAIKLDSSAGSNSQPVYFSGGKPVAIGYTIAKSVPADAKFTDTNTWRGIQNNLISDSTDQSLSAAQGKALKTLVDGKAPTVHTHTKSQITDFPTSMPASDVYAWAKAVTKPSYTKAEVGLGNVDNTADKDKSVKYAETAGTAEKAVAADNGIAAFNVNNTSTMPTGYIRFNNGIQICWGKTYSGNTSGSFTYPQSFSGLPSVMISGTGAYRYAFYVTKFTKTGFEYYRDGSGDTAKPQYIAIGSWEQS